ncbi:NAD-dependent malic enzyme [Flaviflexus massiliensis]|uniref:NAD-dependent malic enzyme n=1 Tax=Flaviflexus massiliensis TaxID=1522309 RepID=UPI0006D53CCA|nr:NAD-dependent malic enzyme [Flaviflexus massiliensis]
MVAPSPGYSITFRVETPASFSASSDLTAAIGETGAAITGLDVVGSGDNSMIIDVSANTRGLRHVEKIREKVNSLAGTRVRRISDRTFVIHNRGKLEISPRIELRNREDLSRAYTPGVARVCLAIAEDKDNARRFTMKANTVAVVTDGTAVLGLGDIGPEAALPVMEGKAILFKKFGNVDAWPVALDTRDTEEIISICKALAPAYGGINLEDISAPRCFEIERRLREELDIPVFHDDQHGTAIVTLAALVNALKVVKKDISDVRVVVSGVGAAGYAIIRLLMASGVRNILAAGRNGVIERGSTHADEHRNWLANNTNEEGFSGSLKEAVVGADVFIGVSAPNVLDGEDIQNMNKDAIVFAMANPDPEVDPEVASEYAAVVATGRSDFPNQINNVLVFPGFFRGLLDAQATGVTDEMMVAAADAIAGTITDSELNPGFLIPSVFDPRVLPAVSKAVEEAARKSGLVKNIDMDGDVITAEG